MIIFIFVCIVFLVLALTKIYAYRRFLRHTFVFRNHKWILVFLLILLYIGEVLFFVLAKEQSFSKVSYMALGACIVLSYCLFVACVIGDVLRVAYRVYAKTNKSQIDQIDPKRREFFKILFDLGILALFFVFSARSFRNATNIPNVREVRIKLENLASPKSIVLISDVHIGKILGRDFLSKVVAKINRLNPDIVVIVGDLIDDDISRIANDLLPLNDLQTKEGVYYVSGNHEYYHGYEKSIGFLETLHLKILHNENIELEGFNLVGIEDLAGLRFDQYKPDLAKAKQGINMAKPSILLAHQPKIMKLYDVSDFDLVLCGHTHAGQVFPISLFVLFEQGFLHGLYMINAKTQAYVSSGVGFWGPAIRFLAPSEIVHITLS